MKSYKINLEKNNSTVKKVRNRTLFFTILSLFIGQLVVINAIGDTDELATVLMISIPIILLVSAISIFTSLKRQRKILESVEIITEENFITKKQFNTTDFRIGRTDIKSISEDTQGNLIISPGSLQKSIIIPKTIEERDALIADLERFKEVEPFKHTPKSKLSIALNAITIAAFLCIRNKRDCDSIRIYSGYWPYLEFTYHSN
jgi:hypothetical protein